MKPLLDKLSPDTAAVLDRRGRRHFYAGGQAIFIEGTDASFLPIVISGVIKMVNTPKVGKEVILGIFRSGEMFALPPVFDEGPYPASAYAVEDTELLQIDRADFLKILRESPEFAFAVISWMSEMLREKSLMIRNFAIASPERRIGHVLIKLVRDQSKPYPVTIPVRRQDIAEMAGLTTETTIRAIRRLADKKLVRIVRGKIMIDEVDSLRKFLAA